MAISMLKIRRPLGRLIFNMGIAIPGKTVFLIETAPRVSPVTTKLASSQLSVFSVIWVICNLVNISWHMLHNSKMAYLDTFDSDSHDMGCTRISLWYTSEYTLKRGEKESINLFHAGFNLGNINIYIYLHFLSFRKTETEQVPEILSHWKQVPLCPT